MQGLFLLYLILIFFGGWHKVFILTFLQAEILHIPLRHHKTLIIAVVVIFQEEIKQFFEFLARATTSPRVRGQRLTEIPRSEIEVLVSTLSDLASERIGALFVLRGKVPIVRHLNAGMDLNGELSEALLKSLVDPHSMGHDGAVVIEANIVRQFSAHLPLSRNLGKVGKGGTRHAAALGLACPGCSRRPAA